MFVKVNVVIGRADDKSIEDLDAFVEEFLKIMEDAGYECAGAFDHVDEDSNSVFDKVMKGETNG